MIHITGLEDVQGFLDRFRVGLSDGTPFFNSLAAWIQDTVKQRVLTNGEGPDGPWPSPYNMYSEMWAAFREEQGHPIDHVYLNYTGGMWSSMTQEVLPDLLRVFFMSTPSNPIRVKGKGKETLLTSNTTNAAKAYLLDKKRPFFGLNEKDVDFVGKKFEAYVQRLIDATR